MAAFELQVARSMHLFKNIPVAAADILAALKLPVFVKPNNGGSSIGMSKVNKAADLQDALEKAFKEDDQVLVEEFIKGREFTIGVFKTGQCYCIAYDEIITKKSFSTMKRNTMGQVRDYSGQGRRRLLKK